MSDSPYQKVSGKTVGADALAHFEAEPEVREDDDDRSDAPRPVRVRQIEDQVRRYEVEWDEQEDIVFAIPCRDLKTGETWEEEFAATGNPGAGGMLEYASLVIVTRDGREMLNAPAIFQFMQRVLKDDGYERFDQLRTDVTVEVHAAAFNKALTDLIKDYTSRPLGLLDDLPRSQRRHGGRSTAKRR